MKKSPKPRKTDNLLHKIREKLKAGNLFDPHGEAKDEVAEEMKEQKKKSEEEQKES